jgi:hypothetical protein
MIEINIALVVLACIFYFLAYQSPETDQFIYGIAATLLLIAGITGFFGYADVITSYNTVSNGGIITTTPVYSNSQFFNYYLPFLEILISLYMYINLVTFRRKTN